MLKYVNARPMIAPSRRQLVSAQHARLQGWCMLAALMLSFCMCARASNQPALSQEDPKMHILAFGDSLTEGFYERGLRFHPYSLMLQQLMNDNALSVKVDQRGESGERVIGGMVHRLPELLRESEAKGIHFSWVIILGGINDIGWRGDPKVIYPGLTKLYKACTAHGAKVLALTCMETAMSTADKPSTRSELNALIRGTTLPGVTVLDLEKALPFPRDPADTKGAALWDDGLHLTPLGYDAMARIIFDALKDKLKEAGA